MSDLDKIDELSQALNKAHNVFQKEFNKNRKNPQMKDMNELLNEGFLHIRNIDVNGAKDLGKRAEVLLNNFKNGNNNRPI